MNRRPAPRSVRQDFFISSHLFSFPPLLPLPFLSSEAALAACTLASTRRI